MAFDAGTIDATLTLNRNPFTAGLAAARSQARGLERERFTATVDVDVDSTDIVKARAEIKSLSNETINLSVRTREYEGVAGAAYGGAASHFQKMATAIIVGAPVMASALSAAVGVVGALSSAMIIAGSGAGALALVAVPTFQKIADAVKGGNAEIAKLPPGLRQAAIELQQLQNEYGKLVEKHQALVAAGLAEWFQAASIAISTLNPLIVASGKAFEASGIQVQKFFSGSQWKEFTTFLAGTMEPTVALLTRGILAAVTAVMNMTEAFWNLGGSKILEMIVSGLEQFAKWTDTLGKNETFIRFMESMQRSLPPVAALLGSVVEFIIKLVIGLEPLGTMIVKVLTMIFDALNKMPPEWLAAIAAGFAAIWAAIALGAGGPVALAIGAAVALAVAFADAYTRGGELKTQIDNLIAPIRDWFIPLAKELAELWEQKVIPAWDKVVAATREHLLPVFEELWKKFVEKVLPALSDLAVTFTGVLLPAILEFWAAVQPIVAYMVKAFGEELIYALELMVRTFDGSFKMIAGLLNAFTGIFTGDWTKFTQGIQQITEGFWTIIAGIFGMSLDELKAKFTEWDNAMRTGWNNFWTYIQNIFIDYGNRMRTEWNNFWAYFENLFRDYSNRMSAEWNLFWNNVWTFVKTVWETMKTEWNTFWTNLWNTFIDYKNRIVSEWTLFWNQIRDFVIWIGQNIVRGVNEFMEQVRIGVDQAADRIGQAWRKVANFFRDPINWVINVVINDGILRAWNTVMGWISQPKLTVAPVGQIPVFAKGGQVTGGVPDKDSVPAYLMPGEYVLSKRMIDGLGGLSAVDQLARAASTGLMNPAASGAAAGRTRQSLMSKVPGMDDLGNMLMAYGGVAPHVAAAGAEIERIFGRLPGGIGGVGARANASDHPSGHALDFMVLSNRGLGDRIAGHLAANWGRLAVKYQIWLQRIASRPGDWRPMANRGSPTANHMDHVHASFLGGPGGAGAAPAMVSWWSLISGQVMNLFNGLLNFGGMPANGSPIGDAITRIPKALVAKVIDVLKAKLEALMTSVDLMGGSGSPTSGPVVDQVRAVAARYGWGSGPEWDALSRLIQKESSWNPNAANPTSSARGLFQKMTSLHGPVEGTAGGQAEWGLNYIKRTYGSPSLAWSAHNQQNWYDGGGILRPGGTNAMNGTGRNEYIFNDGQMSRMAGRLSGSGDIAAIVQEVITSLGGGRGDVYNVMLPPRATVRELADTIEFRRRVSAKGRYLR